MKCPRTMSDDEGLEENNQENNTKKHDIFMDSLKNIDFISNSP